jgi:competence protein ComEA
VRHMLVLVLATLSFSATALEVNTASQAELEQLRGVGVALSERLLDERAKRPFADWKDLRARVPGLGRKQAARLSAAGLRVADQPYPE